MRNATILVVRLRGLATEVIKNIVLSGIGKLIVVDDEVVTEPDLGAGFFYREEDVGKSVGLRLRITGPKDAHLNQRVEAAQSRIQSLNPLVSVHVISTMDVLNHDKIDGIIANVDLVCATDLDKNDMVRLWA